MKEELPGGSRKQGIRVPGSFLVSAGFHVGLAVIAAACVIQWEPSEAAPAVDFVASGRDPGLPRIRKLTVLPPPVMTASVPAPVSRPAVLPSVALPVLMPVSPIPPLVAGVGKAPQKEKGQLGSKPGKHSASGVGGRGEHPRRPAVMPLRPPEPLSTPAPAYPAAARRARASGVAVVRVEVAVNGTVTGATISSSAGRSDFDSAALKAARNWRFRPAMRGNTAVAAAASVRVVFRL